MVPQAVRKQPPESDKPEREKSNQFSRHSLFASSYQPFNFLVSLIACNRAAALRAVSGANCTRVGQIFSH